MEEILREQKSREHCTSESQSMARKEVREPRGRDITPIAKNVSCVFLSHFWKDGPESMQRAQSEPAGCKMLFFNSSSPGSLSCVLPALASRKAAGSYQERVSVLTFSVQALRKDSKPRLKSESCSLPCMERRLLY